ncbi:MAG: hypothetical protein RL885_33220 [Planctomycetota bacterium]
MVRICGYVTIDGCAPVQVRGGLADSGEGRLEAAGDDLKRVRSALRQSETCLLHDLEAGLHLRLLVVVAGGEFSGTPIR